tara:strand:- start:4852 stop:5922 length:1071 start_codon:yes stop_codon:yes gene_type:complete
MNYKSIAKKGRYGDNTLSRIDGKINHTNAWEKYINESHGELGGELVKSWGSGTINPETLLTERYTGTGQAVGSGNPENLIDVDGQYEQADLVDRTYGMYDVGYGELRDATSIYLEGADLIKDQFDYMFGSEDQPGYLDKIYQLDTDLLDARGDKLTTRGLSYDAAETTALRTEESMLTGIETSARDMMQGMRMKEDQVIGASDFASGGTSTLDISRGNKLRGIQSKLGGVGIETSSTLENLGFKRDILDADQSILAGDRERASIEFDKAKFEKFTTLTGEKRALESEYRASTGGVDIGEGLAITDTGSWDDPAGWSGYSWEGDPYANWQSGQPLIQPSNKNKPKGPNPNYTLNTMG